jgi:hypothetical protein
VKTRARAFWIVVALLFLMEAWLWDRLEPIVAWIVGIIPWERIKSALATAISHLSPQATLVVFVIPFILLLPVKFLEVWLLVHRQWLAGLMVLILAKLVGLGVTAFIFEVTKDKLLQMAWFRRVYAFFIWARTWARDKVEPIRRWARTWAEGKVEPIRRRALAWSRETIAPLALRLQQWRRLPHAPHNGRLRYRLTQIRRRVRSARP